MRAKSAVEIILKIRVALSSTFYFEIVFVRIF